MVNYLLEIAVDAAQIRQEQFEVHSSTIVGRRRWSVLGHWSVVVVAVDAVLAGTVDDVHVVEYELFRHHRRVGRRLHVRRQSTAPP